MGDNQKFFAGLIIGAAAGTALALFLQSDKGKEILADMKDAIEDAGDNFKKHLYEFDEDLKKLLQKGKEFAEDIENRMNAEPAAE